MTKAVCRCRATRMWCGGGGLCIAARRGPEQSRQLCQFHRQTIRARSLLQRALQFIRDNKDKPFFLYYPTTVPHLALQVPEDSLAEYKGKLDDKPYTGGDGYLPHQYPHAAYAAMITRMDRDIGRMMNSSRNSAWTTTPFSFSPRTTARFIRWGI